MKQEIILAVNNISFSYSSGVYALKNINFEVRKGDFIGLAGHNGSGKTTLVKLTLGLLTPNSGEISLFGQSLNNFNSWQKVGYLSQNNSLFNPIFPATVEEVVTQGLLSLKHFPKKINASDKFLIKDILEKLKIAHLKNRLIGSLSGGQQQKVFLARAIVTQPDLLILDEPSNALDAVSRQHFFDVLKDLNQNQKTTIILITHDTGFVGRFANKLLYIDQKIIFYGSFSDFCHSNDMGKQFGPDSQHIICHQHD